MLARVRSAAVFGIDASPVTIEVDVSFGLPCFTVVGLPDAIVRESRDRIRSAIRNSGFDFPPHRIVVNLAPADAAWLFEWTDPVVPPEWHGVLNKERGTVVYVHA